MIRVFFKKPPESFLKRYWRGFLICFLIMLGGTLLSFLFFNSAKADFEEIILDDTLSQGTYDGYFVIPTSHAPTNYISFGQYIQTANGSLKELEIHGLCRNGTGSTATWRVYLYDSTNTVRASTASANVSALALCSSGSSDLLITVAGWDGGYPSPNDLNFLDDSGAYFVITISGGSTTDINKKMSIKYKTNDYITDPFYAEAGPSGIDTFDAQSLYIKNTFENVWINPLAFPTLSCDGACPIVGNVAQVDFACTEGGQFFGCNQSINPSCVEQYLNQDCAEDESGILELPVVEGDNNWILYIYQSGVGGSDTGTLNIPYYTSDLSPVAPELLTPDLTVLSEPFTIQARCMQSNSILKYIVRLVSPDIVTVDNCTINTVLETDPITPLTGEHEYCFWVQNDGTVNEKTSDEVCITVTGKTLSDSCAMVNDLSQTLSGDEGVVATTINSFLQRLLNTPLIGDAMIVNCIIYHDFYNNLNSDPVADLNFPLKAFGLNENVPIPLEDVKAQLEGWTSTITGFSVFKATATTVLWGFIIFVLYTKMFLKLDLGGGGGKSEDYEDDDEEDTRTANEKLSDRRRVDTEIKRRKNIDDLDID